MSCFTSNQNSVPLEITTVVLLPDSIKIYNAYPEKRPSSYVLNVSPGVKSWTLEVPATIWAKIFLGFVIRYER